MAQHATNHACVGKLAIPHCNPPIASSSQQRNSGQGPTSSRRIDRFKDVGWVGCSHFRSILATAVTQNSMLLTRQPQPIAGTLPLSARAMNLAGCTKKGCPMIVLEQPNVTDPFRVATLRARNGEICSPTNSGVQLQLINTVYMPRLFDDARQIMRNYLHVSPGWSSPED